MSRSDRMEWAIGSKVPPGLPSMHKIMSDLAAEKERPRSKYHREIKPGVFVDIYDVLAAWKVTNPALSHLIKKALQPGDRGHKTLAQDMQDIVDSAVRAKELAE